MKYPKLNVDTIPIEERHKRILSDLTLSFPKLQSALQIFNNELEKSVDPSKAKEIQFIGTGINQPPTTKEQGVVYSLYISENSICASKFELNHGNIQLLHFSSTDFNSDGAAISIRSPEFTASIFLTAAMESIKELLSLDSNASSEGCIEFFMASLVPIELATSIQSVFLRNFHELCSTCNEDPIDGIDLVELINIGLERGGINAKVIGACNNAIALVMAGSYERPSAMPRCLIGIHVDSHVNAAFFHQNHKEYGLESAFVEADITHFKGNRTGSVENNYSLMRCLPTCIADFEVDYATDPVVIGTKTLERMVALKFIPEICRRLIIHTFQGKTPNNVWVVNSFSSKAALAILGDGPRRNTTAEVLDSCWNWKVSEEQLEMIYQIVYTVFSRSATIIAIVIAAIAKRTGRLQPALGGVTVAISGTLAENKFYQNLVRSHLGTIFERSTSELIQFLDVENAGPKGAAVLCYLSKRLGM